MRSWAQANCIHFVGTLVFDVFLEEVRSEDAALEQEVVIGFESIEHFAEAGGNLLDELLLFCG